VDTLLLKPEEAAAELRLSRATLYQLLASGRLRSVAIGRARRIPREALREFIERLADGQRSGSDASFAEIGPADVPDARAAARATASTEIQFSPTPRLPGIRP